MGCGMLENNQETSIDVIPGSPLKGVLGEQADVQLPGDKSISHRAALFSALSSGTSRIKNFQVSGVTLPMLSALTQLGIAWELKGTTLWVQGKGMMQIESVKAPLVCGNSATTLRLLAGAIAACGIEATLDGSPGLRRRPMARIIDPLRQMGVAIQSENNCAPLSLRPHRMPLQGRSHRLQVASAQVKSCILLAALAADGPTVVIEPGPSRDHTERMLHSMGVTIRSLMVEEAGRPFWETEISPPNQALSPIEAEIPGDISAAAFLIVAAAITPGSHLKLCHVGINPSRTGLIDALLVMGAKVDVQPTGSRMGEPVGDISVSYSPLQPVHISGDLVVRMIDEFPIFMVAAAYANGITEVHQAEELRYKESDRISDMSAELARLGVKIEEFPDGFRMTGQGKLSGGDVDSHGDHRLAMALTVAGLASDQPITIQHGQVFTESFPDFIKVLTGLGAMIHNRKAS